MRDMNTGKEKIVMYRVNTIVQPDDVGAKSDLIADTENLMRDLTPQDSPRDMDAYDSLKPCFEEIAQIVQRPKSATKWLGSAHDSSSQMTKKLPKRMGREKGSLAT